MDNSDGSNWTVIGSVEVEAIDIAPIAESVRHLLHLLPGFALS